jgi:DNA adenine methylase
MQQLRLLDSVNAAEVVNVSSIPQRSPFRYPGGKTWLVPQVRRWLNCFDQKPSLLVEPFAGGGIIGLTAAFEGLTDRVLLVELDEQVASVWHVILEGEAEWLANRLLGFKMSRENLEGELNKTADSARETAFQTILRNRTNHGGIMAPGAGFIKYGENGKGVSSRWYPETLARRIREISKIRNRIGFIQADGFEVIREFMKEKNTAFFIDPPYTAAGKKAGMRLYNHYTIDHEELFAIAESLNGPFLMTYDDATGVRDMASKHGFQVKTVTMSNTHHNKMEELLISKHLDWVR